jgi:hypothetical protein
MVFALTTDPIILFILSGTFPSFLYIKHLQTHIIIIKINIIPSIITIILCKETLIDSMVIMGTIRLETLVHAMIINMLLLELLSVLIIIIMEKVRIHSIKVTSLSVIIHEID